MSMSNVMKIERRNNKNKEIRNLVSKAKEVCFSFFNREYKYSAKEAVDELGLDDELVHQLVEDYVAQIIKSVIQFEKILYALKSNKDAKKELDYTELRELAHKNLGVARNLRIKDGEIILHDLMQKEDLVYLFKCIEVLRASVIVLKPKYAFNTIKLIEVKSTF